MADNDDLSTPPSSPPIKEEYLEISGLQTINISSDSEHDNALSPAPAAKRRKADRAQGTKPTSDKTGRSTSNTARYRQLVSDPLEQHEGDDSDDDSDEGSKHRRKRASQKPKRDKGGKTYVKPGPLCKRRPTQHFIVDSDVEANENSDFEDVPDLEAQQSHVNMLEDRMRRQREVQAEVPPEYRSNNSRPCPLSRRTSNVAFNPVTGAPTNNAFDEHPHTQQSKKDLPRLGSG